MSLLGISTANYVYDICSPHLRLIAICSYQDHTGKMQKQEQLDGKVLMTLPSIEYIYSKWSYFPEGQKKNCIGLMQYSNLLR